MVQTVVENQALLGSLSKENFILHIMKPLITNSTQLTGVLEHIGWVFIFKIDISAGKGLAI
jgi:hypothetical protein